MLEKAVGFGVMMLGSFIITHMVMETVEQKLATMAAQEEAAHAERLAIERESAERCRRIQEETTKAHATLGEVVDDLARMIHTWDQELAGNTFGADAAFRGITMEA